MFRCTFRPSPASFSHVDFLTAEEEAAEAFDAGECAEVGLCPCCGAEALMSWAGEQGGESRSLCHRCGASYAGILLEGVEPCPCSAPALATVRPSGAKRAA